MGLFVSNCPSCNKEIDWFLKPPENYICKCGRNVSEEEIKLSWINNTRRTNDEEVY